MKDCSQAIFEASTVEFVTVAAEYCAFLESSEHVSRREFVDTLLKLLPLLYIKCILLPEAVRVDECGDLEQFVMEDSYEVLRLTLSDILGEQDDYLDVFLADMKYSDTPIRRTISEDLADIWQDIKNFVCQFRSGIHAEMNDALVEVRDNFMSCWGQTLVNTLRALHEVRFASIAEENEDDPAFY